MNRRDRELLNRQIGRLRPAPRHDGILVAAMIGVFLTGLTVGGLVFTFGSNPLAPTASDSRRAALASF